MAVPARPGGAGTSPASDPARGGGGEGVTGEGGVRGTLNLITGDKKGGVASKIFTWPH